jgi:hypothetical protein
MANEIIDVETISVDEPTDKILQLIDELNDKVSNNDGEWAYIKDHGLCWKPNVSAMPGSPPPAVPSPSTPPPSLEEIVQWGNKLDFDNLPQNSVVLIKLAIDDPFRVQMMQKIITKQVLEPRIQKLKDKRTCILFMQSGDDISVMTEEDMGKAGWEKKEKSLIIKPN